MEISPITFPGEINRNVLSPSMYAVTSSHSDCEIIHENRCEFSKKYSYGQQNTAIISQATTLFNSTFSHPQYFESKLFNFKFKRNIKVYTHLKKS